MIATNNGMLGIVYAEICNACLLWYLIRWSSFYLVVVIDK